MLAQTTTATGPTPRDMVDMEVPLRLARAHAGVAPLPDGGGSELCGDPVGLDRDADPFGNDGRRDRPLGRLRG